HDVRSQAVERNAGRCTAARERTPNRDEPKKQKTRLAQSERRKSNIEPSTGRTLAACCRSAQQPNDSSCAVADSKATENSAVPAQASEHHDDDPAIRGSDETRREQDAGGNRQAAQSDHRSDRDERTTRGGAGEKSKQVGHDLKALSQVFAI